jgi:hypothetical protein
MMSRDIFMTNSTTNTTQATIMRRVHTIHVLRSYTTTAIASFFVFAVALWGIGREVWVSRVFQNMPALTNLGAVTRFYIMAFLDTRHIVQFLVLVVAFAAVWFGYSLTKHVRLIQYSFA